MLTLDLYSGRFWWFTALAVAVMLPLKNAAMRRLAFAALNLGFIVLHCRSLRLPPVIGILLGAILLFWLLLLCVSRWPRLRPLLFVTAGALLLGLFVFHKIPQPAIGLGGVKFNPLLSLIGFSYVFLRIIEIARAVGEERHDPPDPASLINYLLPFHMLAAGPIQAYDEFTAQPDSPPPLSVRDSLEAFERSSPGFFKKYVLARNARSLLSD